MFVRKAEILISLFRLLSRTYPNAISTIPMAKFIIDTTMRNLPHRIYVYVFTH